MLPTPISSITAAFTGPAHGPAGFVNVPKFVVVVNTMFIVVSASIKLYESFKLRFTAVVVGLTVGNNNLSHI